MGDLKLAFDTLFVGLFALPWIAVLLELLRPGLLLAEDGSIRLLAGRPGEGKRSGLEIGVILAPLAFVVGAVMAPLSDTALDKRLSFWPLPPSDDTVREDVYNKYRRQVLDSTFPPVLNPDLENFRRESALPKAAWQSSGAYQKSVEQIYQWQKYQAYLNEQRFTILKPMKDQIVVLRGVVLNATLLILASALVLIDRVLAPLCIARGKRYTRVGSICWRSAPAAATGIAVAAPLQYAYLNDKLWWCAAIFLCLVLYRMYTLLTGSRDVRLPFSPFVASLLIGLVVLPLAFSGWYLTERDYDKHVIHLYWADKHKTAAARDGVYQGACDASGAIALGDVAVTASDEDSILRFYDTKSGSSLGSLDLSAHLGTKDEVDFEAGAMIGSRSYWIASHGRKSSGKPAPERQAFAAVDVGLTGARVDARPVGKARNTLQADLLSALDLSHPAIAKRLKAATALAPEEDGFNIEGLAASPKGVLMIGFRSPLIKKRALLVPLLNPDEYIDGKPPKFGPPVPLDLQGLGVRDILYSPNDRAYWILAGPAGTSGSFALFRWNGKDERPRKVKEVDHSRDASPESLVVAPDGDGLLVFLDEGDRPQDGGKCKDAKAEQRSFHSYRLKLPAGAR